MDPTANHGSQRRKAAEILKLADTLYTGVTDADKARDLATLEKMAMLGAELAEAFTGLDNWLSGGGFLPGPWSRNR